ncbi:MAG: hypothetical protein ACRDD1_07395 [Planctomycetia bacterium]
MSTNAAGLVVVYYGLIIAVLLHQWVRGRVAAAFGDRAAYDQGRMTLDPLPHLALFRSILLPAFMLWSSNGQAAVPTLRRLQRPAERPTQYRRSAWVGATVGFAVHGAVLAAFCFAANLTPLLQNVSVDFGPRMVQRLGDLASAVLVLTAYHCLPLPMCDAGGFVRALLPDRWQPTFDGLDSEPMIYAAASVVFSVAYYLLGSQLFLAGNRLVGAATFVTL